MWYKLNWLSGEPSYVEGESIQMAVQAAGYGGGAMRALDYWEELKELPEDRKLCLFNDNGEWLEFGGLFAGIIKPQIMEGNKSVSVSFGNREFAYTVEETPFSFRLCKV